MPTPRAKFLRALAYGWRGYSNLAGVGLIACGAGLAIVNYVSGDDAVMTYYNLRDLPEKVPYKGTYTYVVDADVRESCPGEIVIVFSNRDPLQASFVTQRRPSALTDVRLYQDIRITNSLPPTVNPGKWHVSSSRVSHCANRERVDPLTSYDIEVVP